MTEGRSIAEVLSSLEAQAAFHREREAFHAAEVALHEERRSAHAAELAEIARRLEQFRAAAGEALDFADRAVPVPAPEEDIGPASRPDVGRLVDLMLQGKGARERFGPATLTKEINLRFRDRLRRPVSGGQISVLLRRLSEKGKIHLVRRGRPHWEALYVKEAEEGT